MDVGYIYGLDEESERGELISMLHPWDERNRFNDDKWVPQSRLRVGTINLKKDLENSELLVVNKDHLFRKVMAGLTIIFNGLSCNVQKKEFYNIVTPKRRVTVYSFHETNGAIGKGNGDWSFSGAQTT